MAGSWCVQRFAGRFCLRWDAERREKYLNSVLWMLFSGTEECALCPEAMSSRDRRLIAEDMLEELDYSNIPNYALVDEADRRASEA